MKCLNTICKKGITWKLLVLFALELSIWSTQKENKKRLIYCYWLEISGSICGIIFTQLNVRHPNNKTHGKRLQDIFYINIFFNTISCQILWERIFLLILKSNWIAFLFTSPQEFEYHFHFLKVEKSCCSLSIWRKEG